MTYTTIPMRQKGSQGSRKLVDSRKQADKHATITLRKARRAKQAG